MVIKLLVEEWLVVDLQMGMHGGVTLVPTSRAISDTLR